MQRPTFLVAVSGVWLLASVALAGPYVEFETQLRAAYSDYRGALFQTNKNDKAATLDALAKLEAKWSGLVSKWAASPPPQYADDAKFGATLAGVGAIVGAATAEAARNELAKAHETLEKIRDELGALRERNGVTTFSDRMNIYHTKMESVLTDGYSGFDATGLGRLREDAAVLAFLAADIAAKPPADGAGKPEFTEALGALKASVDALVVAARSGDAAGAKKAVSALKGPYSMLFLKFG